MTEQYAELVVGKIFWFFDLFFHVSSYVYMWTIPICIILLILEITVGDLKDEFNRDMTYGSLIKIICIATIWSPFAIIVWLWIIPKRSFWNTPIFKRKKK